MKVRLEISVRGTIDLEVPDLKLEALEKLGDYCEIEEFEAATGVTVEMDDLNITDHEEIRSIDILSLHTNPTE